MTAKQSMTMVEKIIAAHSGRDQVEPGELVSASVDLVMANDITAPLAIEAFNAMGAKKVFDRGRVALVLSHFSPAKDIASAGLCQEVRDFSRCQAIEHLVEVGEGIEHVVLPERGLVVPGDLVLGADSHTCTYGALSCLATGVGSTDLGYAMATGTTWLRVPETILLTYHGRPGPWVTGKDLILHTLGELGVDGATYRALEFSGDALRYVRMEDRLTMANMVVEGGAKAGIFPADRTAHDYLANRARRRYTTHKPDPGAVYHSRFEFDVSGLEPQVALPSSPDNVQPVRQVGEISIDQAFIGSCTNGRISDLRRAAEVLRGQRVHREVRLLIIPGSRAVYRQALTEGLIQIFTDAGATVGSPTCGPCIGGHMGVLGKGERCVSTSNRNFVGRMGHPESEAYLTNPAVAAASAVRGRLCHPDDLGISWEECI